MVEIFAQHCATGAQHSFLRINDFMIPPFVMTFSGLSAAAATELGFSPLQGETGDLDLALGVRRRFLEDG